LARSTCCSAWKGGVAAAVRCCKRGAMHRVCTECDLGFSKGTVGIQAPTQVIIRTTEARLARAIVPPISNLKLRSTGKKTPGGAGTHTVYRYPSRRSSRVLCFLFRWSARSCVVAEHEEVLALLPGQPCCLSWHRQ
jgi:hypothetical protein